MLLHSAEIKGRQKRGATGRLPRAPHPPFPLCTSPGALLWGGGFLWVSFSFFVFAVAFWRRGSGSPLKGRVLNDEESFLD